jgi:hypothetical protein
MSPLRNTAPAPTQRRHMARVVTALGIAVAAGLTSLAAACSDGPAAPTDPRPAPAADLATTTTSTTSTSTTTSGSTTVGVTALLRLQPLGAPVTRSVTLGGSGGTLSIPEVGLTVTIPANAIPKSPMTITATALPGRVVAYDFQPHGTRFLSTIKIRQELAGTTWANNTGRLVWEGGYFLDPSHIDQASGTATVSETFRAAVTGNTVNFWTSHFSGYLMSTGRVQ